MKKRIFTVMVVVLGIALAFTSCKGGGKDDGVIELRVLNYFSLANPGAAEENSRVWDAFEKAHPEIRIIREDEFNEPFHHKTESYAAAGQLPDIIQCWPSGRSTTLHTQRLLKDLMPLVKRDGLASVFTQVSLDPSQQGAGYLGMITRGLTATNAFFVNMEVLRDCGLQPAKTYSELKAQVPVLKAKGYETIIMPCEDTWVMQSCLFSSVAGRFCGEGWEQKIISGQAKFTDPDFVAALNFIKQMYDDGVLLRSTIAIDYGSGPGLFATNKCAYYIDGDWRVGDFLTDQSTGQALISPARQKDILISVFPDIDVPGVKFNKSNTVVLATGWGMSSAIPEGSAKEEAAWTLLKWLTGKEAQSFFVETGTFATPSRTDIDLASLPLEPLQVTVANLGKEYNVSTVVIDAAFEGPVYTPLNDGLQAIGMGTQTPQQVAAATQAAFEAWKATQ
ncbi:MAG: ABC transporter substrate-binding protein [Treponema sp.]|jgi:raffinose/stachyose/melibiose transport system substrate-binding protein|nr:ABC transporter substrate-binding protein [Treponema sp.]